MDAAVLWPGIVAARPVGETPVTSPCAWHPGVPQRPLAIRWTLESVAHVRVNSWSHASEAPILSQNLCALSFFATDATGLVTFPKLSPFIPHAIYWAIELIAVLGFSNWAVAFLSTHARPNFVTYSFPDSCSCIFLRASLAARAPGAPWQEVAIEGTELRVAVVHLPILSTHLSAI